MKRAFTAGMAIALCLFAIPAGAEVYLTKDQALKIVFGEGCEISYDPKPISEHLLRELDDLDAEPEPEAKEAHFFLCKRNGVIAGYALIDQEIGKHLPITYIVGFSPAGSVTRVEMMVFRERIGWEARERRFMQQFEGLNGEIDRAHVGAKIKSISGATLSSRAITKGVRRANYLWNKFYRTERL